MFGYVLALEDQLTPESWQRYRGAYCGLCRTLGTRFGQRTRLTLTYDMTFLVLLLSSLYEPQEQCGTGRCLMHPVHARAYWHNAATDYAAAMNVLLAREKLLDDWRDDKNLAARAGGGLLQQACARAEAQYPRQCAAIRRELEALSALERQGREDPDAAANCFGRLMAELFCWKDDRWAPQLSRMGMALGRFIYLMDAWEDAEADIKKNRYNPLKAQAARPDFDTWMGEVLMVILGDCAEAMEQLPLVQDTEILRTILYAGVWNRYARKLKQKERGSTDA